MKQDNQIIFLRHGNTFESGETALWVGARTDLPLTTEGAKQALRAQNYLRENNIKIAEVIAGPLQRTRQTAAIAGMNATNLFSADKRLCEIDYGKWEGLSSAEISARFGLSVLEKWEKEGLWPEGMEWTPSLETYKAELLSFLNEQREKLLSTAQTRLVVTSNGILRLIHALVTGQSSGTESKVATGCLCALSLQNNDWQITAWNVKP